MKIPFLALGLIGLVLLNACKKEEILPLNVESVTANGIDLNATDRPTGIAVDAVITLNFNTDVNPPTVSSANIKMTREYDSADVSLTFIVSRGILTVKSDVDLLPGTRYKLSVSAGLTSLYGKPFEATTYFFKTAGTFVPAGQVAYWSFDDSTDDILGNRDPIPGLDVIAITFAASKNLISGHAASFNGMTSIIQVPDGATLLGPEFSISFWMKLDGGAKGSYVLGIGNVNGLQVEIDPGYQWLSIFNGLALGTTVTAKSNFKYYPNGVTYKNLPDSSATGIENATVSNRNIGTDGLRQKLDKVWSHVVFTFLDSTKTRSLYIDGELMYRQELGRLANPAVAPGLRTLAEVTGLKFITDVSFTYDDKLVMGFNQSTTATYGDQLYSDKDAKHFKGLLDDVRIFNRCMTDEEVMMVYGDEKP